MTTLTLYFAPGASSMAVHIALHEIGVALRWLVPGVGVAGWLSVMLSVWILGGTAIFCIGVFGIYLGKVFMETKNRPYTIVRKVHQAQPMDAGAS